MNHERKARNESCSRSRVIGMTVLALLIMTTSGPGEEKIPSHSVRIMPKPTYDADFFQPLGGGGAGGGGGVKNLYLCPVCGVDHNGRRCPKADEADDCRSAKAALRAAKRRGEYHEGYLGKISNMSCTTAMSQASIYTDWKSADERRRDAEWQATLRRWEAEREAGERRRDAERERYWQEVEAKRDARDAKYAREKAAAKLKAKQEAQAKKEAEAQAAAERQAKRDKRRADTLRAMAGLGGGSEAPWERDSRADDVAEAVDRGRSALGRALWGERSKIAVENSENLDPLRGAAVGLVERIGERVGNMLRGQEPAGDQPRGGGAVERSRDTSGSSWRDNLPRPFRPTVREQRENANRAIRERARRKREDLNKLGARLQREKQREHRLRGVNRKLSEIERDRAYKRFQQSIFGAMGSVGGEGASAGGISETPDPPTQRDWNRIVDDRSPDGRDQANDEAANGWDRQIKSFEQ